MMRHRLGLIHPVDPRSDVPGLAARLRGIIARRPDDFSILLVGVDACGDLPIGRTTRLEADGRAFDFLPLLRSSTGPEHAARAGGSSRLAFRMALWRHLAVVRQEMRASRASIELHEFAWAPCARLLGHPVVQVMQSGGRGRRGRVNRLGKCLALRFATRIVGDDESVDRLRSAAGAAIAAKTEVIFLVENATGRDGERLCLEAEIQRLYERHRRLFRVTRTAV